MENLGTPCPVKLCKTQVNSISHVLKLKFISVKTERGNPDDVYGYLKDI